MSKDINQVAEYRAKQKLAYDKKIREEYLIDKLKKLLEFNPIKRSASRIVNAVKRHILHTPINEEVLNTIPGIFRLRLFMTELNTFPLNVQRESFRTVMKEQDPAIVDILLQSLKESYQYLFWVVIDLRIYGPNPEMEIYLSEYNQMLYLSDDQINKVKNIWNKVNPDIVNGIRFQQMLESSKSLVSLYNLSNLSK